MFKIGDFSKLSKVSVRMLRYYDKQGLFSPEKTDSFTGYRYYSANQIERLNEIIRLRDLGFNVSEITMYLAEPSIQERTSMLEQKRSSTLELIELETRKLHLIDEVVLSLKRKKHDVAKYNAEIKSIPSYKAVSYRKTIPSYDQEGKLWDEMSIQIRKNKIKTTGPFYAAYHDSAFKKGDVDVEIVMKVSELGNDIGDLRFKETEPIEKAVCVYVTGDYTNINHAYAYLASYIELNGMEICSSPRQVPIMSPFNEKDPNKYLTEIQIPVK